MKFSQTLSGCCLFASLALHAAPALNPVELSDQELAQLRGRYVLPGHVVHFGITMTSSWTNADQTLNASVSLQAQQGMPKPLLTVTSTTATTSGGNAPVAGTGIVIGGQGLHNVEGISQSVRTAGDLNTAHNNLRINISRNGQPPALNTSGTLLEGQSIQQNGLGTATVRTSSNGGLQIAIQAPGQGGSLQQLGGGGLQQNTTITSSNNVVSSLAQLDVVLKSNTQTLDGLNCNLDQFRGLRPIGY